MRLKSKYIHGDKSGPFWHMIYRMGFSRELNIQELMLQICTASALQAQEIGERVLDNAYPNVKRTPRGPYRIGDIRSI